jgi:hypothetical protein
MANFTSISEAQTEAKVREAAKTILWGFGCLDKTGAPAICLQKPVAAGDAVAGRVEWDND